MGLFDSETQVKQTENSTAKTDPWAGQSKYLKDIFGEAQDIYNTQKNQSYGGDVFAQFNPQQLDTFQQMIDYSNSSTIPGSLQWTGEQAIGQGISGLESGMAGYQNFQPVGTTESTIQDASQFASNPYMDSMVDAAMRDANRQVYEGQLPQNQRNRAMSGNTNSSKGAIADAVLERGLQDRAADVGAALRGSAYSQGLDLAQNQNQFNTNAELERLNGLTGYGLEATGLGTSALGGSLVAQNSLFDIGQQGGAGLQEAEQANLNNEMAKYQLAQESQWAPLQNYYDIVGAGNWGSETKANGNSNQNATQSPSTASIIGGLLGAGGSWLPA